MPVSRRELFTFWRRDSGSGSGSDSGSGSGSTPAVVYLRPPGAIAEELFLDTCQRCGKCVDVCPRSAILPLPESFGPAAGTPAIVARQAPCVVCAGLQCTQVCPSGALRRVAVFDIQMGTAVVDARRCVTWKGEECGMCVTHCPVAGAIAAVEGHPVVDAGRCVGCGVCEHVCPTETASITVHLV